MLLSVEQKENREKWIARLRSGHIHQIKGQLANEYGECALGCAIRAIDEDRLEDVNGTFVAEFLEDGHEETWEEFLSKSLGMSTNDLMVVAGLNDKEDEDWTFQAIADELRRIWDLETKEVPA